jgi:hypothetical protein
MNRNDIAITQMFVVYHLSTCLVLHYFVLLGNTPPRPYHHQQQQQAAGENYPSRDRQFGPDSRLPHSPTPLATTQRYAREREPPLDFSGRPEADPFYGRDREYQPFSAPYVNGIPTAWNTQVHFQYLSTTV